MFGPLRSIGPKLTTLLSRVPSNNATLVANLDAAMSTRAPSSSALSTAVWTAGHAAACLGAVQKTDPLIAVPQASGIGGTFPGYNDYVAGDFVENLAGPYTGVNITSTTETNLVSITGAGYIDLLHAVISGVQAESRSVTVKLTIDGVIVIPLTATSISPSTGRASGKTLIGTCTLFRYWDGSAVQNIFNVTPGKPIPFRESLVISGYETFTSYNPTSSIKYNVVRTA